MNTDDLFFLPEEIAEVLEKLDMDKLIEIRMRAGAPVVLNYDFKRVYLGREYITLNEKDALRCDCGQICSAIFKAAEFSVYAANETLKTGFITTAGGIRIGIGGECVMDKGNVVTIKDFTSLCIRIPHFIVGAAEELIRRVNGLHNTLIVSPPGYGKTTILKDLARSLLSKYNVLLIDERGELNDERLAGADIVRYCDKMYAFQYGIRSLAPQVVLTDELSGKNDWNCVEQAVSCGVKTVATLHGASIADVNNKPEFKKGLFERYVVLRSEGRAGAIRSVYDENFHELY